MTMVFVERRGGAVVGVYAVAQPGYAEEALSPDHEDVLAYRSAREARRLAVSKSIADRLDDIEAMLLKKENPR